MGKGEERAGGDLLKLKLAQLGRAGGQHQRGGADTQSESVAVHGLDGLISDDDEEEEAAADGDGAKRVVRIAQGSKGEGEYGRIKQHKLWVQLDGRVSRLQV